MKQQEHVFQTKLVQWRMGSILLQTDKDGWCRCQNAFKYDQLRTETTQRNARKLRNLAKRSTMKMERDTRQEQRDAKNRPHNNHARQQDNGNSGNPVNRTMGTTITNKMDPMVIKIVETATLHRQHQVVRTSVDAAMTNVDDAKRFMMGVKHVLQNMAVVENLIVMQ